jgi:5-methylcytosine-specific restriction endonuclease McrA
VRLKEAEFEAVVATAAHMRQVSHRTPELTRMLSRAYGFRIKLRHVETICRMASCSTVGPYRGERPPLPGWLKTRVLRGQSHCALCRKGFSGRVRPEIAHLIPVRLGGVTASRNLAALCFDCNRHQGGGLLAVEEYARIWRI